MKNNLKNLFTEDVLNLLSEDSLNEIQKAFDDKVTLSVEAALLEQDEVYAQKLKVLIESIDKDHTLKMRKLVEAVDRSNASKLAKLVKLYERELKVEPKKFKAHLIESVSAYLQEYLAEAIDKKDLAQAVKNKTAYNVLENMRKVLAVDSVMMKESIQEAVIDGKKQLDSLQKENDDLKNKYKALYEANQKMQVNVLLENKTSKFPEAKKSFVRKALEDKSVKFIEENFDYTVRLFERQEKNKIQVLKEEALNKRTVKPDVVPQVKFEKVEEQNINILADDYLNILSRGKGMK